MRPKVQVRVERFETVEEIDGAWTAARLAALLDAMDYGSTADLTDAELREMTVLSLQDRSPAEAAELLLANRVGDRLTLGQRQTLGHDLTEEKLWEHHADMSLHEELFHVASLAYQAFPRVFHTPDAARVHLALRPENAAAREAIAAGVREPMLVRLLAEGMDESAILRRLFGEALAGGPFPEAESIVWSFEARPLDGGGVEVDLLSSGYWLDPLADVEAYTAVGLAAPPSRS